MKKVVIGFLALVSASAFAADSMGNGKSMITLGGYEHSSDASLQRTFDIYHSNGGGSHSTQNSIAFNYAYAFTDYMQAGVNFRYYKNDGIDKERRTANQYGIFGIWNFRGQLTDTNYLAVKLNGGDKMYKDQNGDKDKKQTGNNQMIGFEFGHRFSLGSHWGMNYNWSPSLELDFGNFNPDKGSNQATTTLVLNILKVDVLF